MKAMLDFNAGKITSEDCVTAICAGYNEQENGSGSGANLKCPRGHILTQAPPSINWTCDGRGEIQGCALGPEEVTPTTERWRCATCNFDYCGACYSLRKEALDSFHASTGPPALNRDGILTVLSMDTYHTRQQRHYCGRAVGQRGYFNGPCRGCNGTCGPHNGCQCVACFLLDNPTAVRNAGGDLHKLDDSGWIYAGKVLSLFLDLERRCALQLELLRKYPKISVPCCGTHHCFLCKITGHHAGRTCEEVQRAAFGQECQYCPSCGVPTLRTEGCDHIICPCGRNWHWDNSRPEPDDGPALTFGGIAARGGRGGGRGGGRIGQRDVVLGRGRGGRVVLPTPVPAAPPGGARSGTWSIWHSFSGRIC